MTTLPTANTYVLFNDDGTKAVDELTKLNHYILFIEPPKSDEKGMAIIAVDHGTFTPDELRDLLRQYYVPQKQSRIFLNLYKAHEAAIAAGLYTPQPPARWVHLKSNRPLPIPKDLRL